MMLMTGNMYSDKILNSGIMFVGVVLFGLALGGLRTQTTIVVFQYMKPLIPNYSSAIMVNKHVAINDLEVRALADSIISSQ